MLTGESAKAFKIIQNELKLWVFRHFVG